MERKLLFIAKQNNLKTIIKILIIQKMKNSILPKLILTLGVLFNFTLPVNSEIIPITYGNSSKHLPTSAKSKVSGNDDGTLICWLDSTHGGSIYIQKIDLDGQLQWGDNGVALDIELGMSFDPDSDYPMIYSDNLGGALVIYGKDFYSSREIYIAKIYFNGIPARIPVCITSHSGGFNFSPVSVLTRDSCFAVAWESFVDGDFNIHAQKIDLDGNLLWNKGEEVVVCSEIHDQRKPTITCDESNCIVITWLDDRYSNNYPEFAFDLFANRLSPDGNYTQYSSKGKLIFSYYENEFKPFDRIENKTNNKSEMNGAATDSRKMAFYNHNLISSDKNSTIFAVDQWDRDFDSFIKILKVDENFNMVWIRSIDENSFQFKPLLTGDNNKGAYVFWNDYRNAENSVYGIGLDMNGNITMGGESGIKISCDKMKGSFKRTLPSDKNQNGIYSEANKIYLTWVTSWNDDLILSSINPLSKYSICGNTAYINSDVTGGEYTSITTQKNNTVVVFKQSQNIFAWRNVNANSDKEDLKNKITICNFPNPFNPVTKIKFNIPRDARRETQDVKLVIFNALGEEVSTLVNGRLAPGSYETDFDASNFPSGVYFYRIEMNGWIETKRMTLIK